MRCLYSNVETLNLFRSSFDDVYIQGGHQYLRDVIDAKERQGGEVCLDLGQTTHR